MGIVYIVTNPAFPGLVKIGRTTNLENRLQQLGANLPEPFEVFFTLEVENADEVERLLHHAFHGFRTARGEFFEIAPERARSALKLVNCMPATATAQQQTAQTQTRTQPTQQQKAPPFRFSLADVPIGATITYYYDERITAKVHDDRRILFRGEVTSLTAAAKKLLNVQMGISGPHYWRYKGEILAERRRRLEN